MNWLKRLFGPKTTSISLPAFEPSHVDLYNVCMTYRHDYGLLSLDEQLRIRNEAVCWLQAWGHTIPQFRMETNSCPNK